MKATGIVRRIDDLGRVVIPKEIRKTLRIREGDPLEIFTDKDSVIAVSGAPKREFLDKNISYELEKIMNDKTTWVVKSASEKRVPIFNNESLDKYYAQVISPIVSEGDTIGSVVLMATEASSQMGDAEVKLAQSAAGFLGKQMEQ